MLKEEYGWHMLCSQSRWSKRYPSLRRQAPWWFHCSSSHQTQVSMYTAIRDLRPLWNLAKLYLRIIKSRHSHCTRCSLKEINGCGISLAFINSTCISDGMPARTGLQPPKDSSSSTQIALSLRSFHFQAELRTVVWHSMTGNQGGLQALSPRQEIQAAWSEYWRWRREKSATTTDICKHTYELPHECQVVGISG